MHALLRNTLLVAVVAIFVWSCEKDETKAIMKSGNAPTLAVSNSTLVLEQDNAADTVVVFSWDDVNYGFNDAISYSLQISKAGTDFAPATTTEIGLNTKSGRQALTVKALNMELNKIIKSGEPTAVEVRLKADAANIYSNVITMTVTSYRELIVYAFPAAINVAGNFQNWSPFTAPQIVSRNKDGNYEGFINFDNSSPKFKFVKGNDWSAGDFGSAGAGKLGNGGPDLDLPSSGTYLIRVNTNDMSWSADKIDSWGLIGDAVPGTGWDSDQDMTFDPAANTWSITLNLNAGAIKFRANNAWDINLGDKGNDGKPELGGDNIPISEAGNYTITLDVSVGGNWVYTIKKN